MIPVLFKYTQIKFDFISYLQKTYGQKSCANPLAPLTSSLRFGKLLTEAAVLMLPLGTASMLSSESPVSVNL